MLERSMHLVHKKPTHTDKHRYQTSFKEIVVSSYFNKAYTSVTREDVLNKENTRIKQVLTKSRYK